MTIGTWIHRHQILSIDQTDLNGRLSLALEQLSRIGDMAWPLGLLGGTLVGTGSLAMWGQGLLPRPLAPCVHTYHHFGLFLLYFLHTNNSTSTSETR